MTRHEGGEAVQGRYWRSSPAPGSQLDRQRAMAHKGGSDTAPPHAGELTYSAGTCPSTPFPPARPRVTAPILGQAIGQEQVRDWGIEIDRAGVPAHLLLQRRLSEQLCCSAGLEQNIDLPPPPSPLPTRVAIVLASATSRPRKEHRTCIWMVNGAISRFAHCYSSFATPADLPSAPFSSIRR